MRDRNFDKLELACGRMRERIDRIIEQGQLKAMVRGPIPAVISRLQRFHRMQIIIQAPEAAVMQRLFAGVRAEQPVRPTVGVAIDIDALHVM